MFRDKKVETIVWGVWYFLGAVSFVGWAIFYHCSETLGIIASLLALVCAIAVVVSVLKVRRFNISLDEKEQKDE